MTTTPEAVPVLICTKDRADDVVRAVRSLLCDEQQHGEVIVIDQSVDDRTEVALTQIHDSRLRYIRSATSGKGGALNEGLHLVATRFVACTDDDCEATAGWAQRMVAPMQADPRIALTFSRVDTPPYDGSTGYIPGYTIDEDRLLRHPLDMRKGWGLGAGMAIRRDALLDAGGFDAAMGPGGRYPSADDFDVELRLLLLGWHVYEHAGARVVHHGFRTRAEGKAHAVRDWSALGASCAKAVRAKHLQVLVLSTWVLWTRAVWPAAKAAVRLRKPPLRRVAAFTSGFFAGIRQPIDVDTIRYLPR